MILKIPCHWVLWLKFIAVITDIMACWVARYYRQRSEGKKELVRDDYKIVSDWLGQLHHWTRTRYLEMTIINLSPSPGGSFIMSQPAHRCLYLVRSNTLTLKMLCLSSKVQLSTLRAGGRGSSILSSLSLSILPRLCYNWIPTEKGII